MSAEQIVSPTLFPTCGLLQGCPCAPSICKIALFTPLQSLLQGDWVTTLNLWLDDLSMDFVGEKAAPVAHRALQALRLLKAKLAERQLPMNSSKTKIVASDKKVAEQLRLQQQEGDPAIANLAVDLGVDSSAARMRRLQTFEGRLNKAKGRLGCLNRVNLSARGRLRMVWGSIVRQLAFTGTVPRPFPQAVRLDPNHDCWCWKTIAGPLATGTQYLRDLDWCINCKDNWTSPEGSFVLRFDDWTFRRFRSIVCFRAAQEVRSHGFAGTH